MTLYQKYLASLNVVSEDKFNYILNQLPSYSTNIDTIPYYVLEFSCTDLGEELMDRVILDSTGFYSLDFNIEKKTLLLESDIYISREGWNDLIEEGGDIEDELSPDCAIENLTKIKERFDKSGWTIENYDQLIKLYK